MNIWSYKLRVIGIYAPSVDYGFTVKD